MTISLRFVSPNWHWELFCHGVYSCGIAKSLHAAWVAVNACVDLPNKTEIRQDNEPGYIETEFWR